MTVSQKIKHYLWIFIEYFSLIFFSFVALLPEESKEFLKLFSFICLLSFDVYMKKLLIEKLVDEIKEKDPKSKKEK